MPKIAQAIGKKYTALFNFTFIKIEITIIINKIIGAQIVWEIPKPSQFILTRKASILTNEAIVIHPAYIPKATLVSLYSISFLWTYNFLLIKIRLMSIKDIHIVEKPIFSYEKLMFHKILNRKLNKIIGVKIPIKFLTFVSVLWSSDYNTCNKKSDYHR